MLRIVHRVARLGVASFALLLVACNPSSRLGQANVQADGLFRDFAEYCTTTAEPACAGMSLRVTYLGDGTSVLLLRIRNLQGTNPLDLTDGWRLSHLAFGTEERGGSNTGIQSFGLSGTVGSYGAPDSASPFDPIPPQMGDSGPVPGVILSWHNASQMQGLVGCTQVPLDTAWAEGSFPFLGAWQTCPSLGQDGAFFVAIHMSWELLDAAKLFVSWRGQTASGQIVACDTRAAETCGATSSASIAAGAQSLLLHNR